MNNFKKIGLSALAGSLVAFSATADMSVSGQAQLFMTATDETGKTTFSNSDHVTFSGSSELDNGMTVSYSLQLDGDEADDGVIDNHSVTIDTNGAGTIVYAGHGGDSAMSGMDDKTPNAYEEAWDGLTTTGVDSVINGISGNDLIRYTSPSIGGAQIIATIMPSNTTGSYNGVYNDFGVVISPEMVEGLEIGMAMGETEATSGTPIDDQTYYFKYTYGPVTVGYQRSESDATTATNSDESDTMGISYQVTDDFSVSYNTHDYNDGAWTSDEEYSGVSASYTMGGITIAGHVNELSNKGGSATAADVEGYELNLGFAF